MQDIQSRAQEEVFVRSLEGVFDAIHISELQDEAQKFARDLSLAVFMKEIKTTASSEVFRRYPSPLLSSYLEALPHALAREATEDAKKAQGLISLIIQDLVAMVGRNGVKEQDIILPLHQIASRFSALCLEDSWVRKSAGCSGIRIMTCTPDLGVKWINDREVDLVRTLLHVLKDLASDLPRDVDDVVDVLIRVLRVSNGDKDVSDITPHARSKVSHLIGIFSQELSSSNAVVRHAAQTCIELLTKVSGKSAYELLMPQRDRLLSTIYAKPLRALPFPIQIGMIEAIRYCVSLDPPLPDLNEELLRLLHECLAAADADDSNLLGGRGNLRQGGIEVIKLRVACIKLLTASMPMTDFFSKQHTTRQRYLYFIC
jgi:transformation/transcription domain-associated protein